MNDISEYNSNGWASVHEAAYAGSVDELNLIFEHARDLHRNVVDMKTVDDMKTTPLLIAALGGHIEIMRMLLNNGADINAQLTFRGIVQHGLVEVAAIRQDFDLLAFLYDKFPDLSKRLRNLMISPKLDEESRVAVGRTIEILSQEYPIIKSTLNEKKNSLKSLTIQQIIAHNTINNSEFASSLVDFFELGSEADEATVSTVMILLNVMPIDAEFRARFLRSKGVNKLIGFMRKQKVKLNQKIEGYRKKFKINIKIDKKPQKGSPMKKRFFNSQGNSEIKTENDYSNENPVEETEPDDEEDYSHLIDQETYIQCACIGQCLGIFSKHPECLDSLNNENFNEYIIDYINTLFDWNSLCKEFNIFETINPSSSDNDLTSSDAIVDSSFESTNDNDTSHFPILFEQYICSYLICLGHLAHNNPINKQFILKFNLFEKLIDFWRQLLYLAENNKSLNAKHNKDFNSEHEGLPGEETALNENNNNEDKETVIVDLKITSLKRILDKLSSSLIKQLKIAIIDCIGRMIFRFDNLKIKYIYSYQETISNVSFNVRFENTKDWPKLTNEFIKQLITFLDTSVCLDRELQLCVIKFLKLICEDDYKIILKLVDQTEVTTSNLINSIRSLLRKSTLEIIRINVMELLWMLTGGEQNFEFYDRKCFIYRAIGSQRFIDTLFDGDDHINLICLEALSSILESPPHRDKETHQLVKIQEEVAKLHAIPAVLRLLKSTNETLLIAALKSIVASCVAVGYSINVKNQTIVSVNSGISAIIDLCKIKANSIRLKTEAYYTLSMVCLGNLANKQTMLECIDYRVDILINQVRSIWLNEKPKVNINQNEELEDLDMQFKAGLALCGFCYKTEDFTRKILQSFGRVKWDYFRSVLIKLNVLFENVIANDDQKAYFNVQKLRCFFGFQISSLNNLISYSNEDPRAIGIKLMIDCIPKTKNTYLRAIACDYIGRVILYDDCLLECFIAINAIETISKSTYDPLDKSGLLIHRGEAEKGSASITLGFFADMHPEARRRILKLSRKNFKIMEALRYSNELINIDLKRDWNHFKQLSDVVSQPTPASHHQQKVFKYNKFEKLPPIANKNKKNNALIT